MSDMKCPICKKELRPLAIGWCCDCGMYGSKELWQELIRTRKALDVALDWLGQVATPEKCDDTLCCEFTKRKLAEIKTALEQKDK